MKTKKPKLSDMQIHVLGLIRTYGRLYPFGLQLNSCKALAKRGLVKLEDDNIHYTITPAGQEAHLEQVHQLTTKGKHD